MKIKVKSYGYDVYFYDQEAPKVDSNHNCLAVIIIFDSGLNKDRNYCLQVFLNEYKYIEKKVIRHIIDDLESSSDDSH